MCYVLCHTWVHKNMPIKIRLKTRHLTSKKRKCMESPFGGKKMIGMNRDISAKEFNFEWAK